MLVSGKNVFNELISNNKTINSVYLEENFKDNNILNTIKNNNIKYTYNDKYKMNNLIDENHQGIIMNINDFIYSSFEDIIKDNIIVILDHLNDPHNFGAIIRTCEAAGIKSIIIPSNRSVSVNSTVYKTSAGAINNVNICLVNNIVDTINKLKKLDYFIYGAEADGINYKEEKYTPKTVLIIGSEGNGLSQLVKKNCDSIVSLPMYGKVNSLNASVASAIFIYDIISKVNNDKL